MKYKLSYTAAALMLNESIKIAEAYQQYQDWAITRKVVLEENLLQKNKQTTAKRTYLELSQRLQKLTPLQLERLLDFDASTQSLLLFVAICKTYRFIGEFVVEVVRDKFLMFDYVILASDYTRFYNQKMETHEELFALTKLTRQKLRSTMLLMMVECGLINNRDDKWITPPILNGALVDILVQEDPALLKFLLVADADIQRMTQQQEKVNG